MEKSICFIELLRDNNGFIIASQTIETACIRTYLKKNGLETMVYIDDTLPSISDTADDILSLSDEVLVFVVHEECKDMVNTLIYYLKELEDVEIYVLGDLDNITEEAVLIIDSDEEELLSALGGQKQDGIEIINISPYKEEVLHIRDIAHYGIWLGNDRKQLRTEDVVKNEIEIANKVYSETEGTETKHIVLTGSYINSKEIFEDLLQVIRKNDSNVTFVIPVSSELVKDLSYIIEISNVKLDIQCKGQAEGEKLQIFIDLLQKGKTRKVSFPAKWLEEKTQFIMVLIMAHNSKLIELTPVGELDIQKVDEQVLAAALHNTRKEYLPLYRGYLKSKTGFYSDIKLDGYIHHIEISKEQMEENSLEFMNENVSIKSSVWLKDITGEKQDGKIFFNDKGIAYVENSYENQFLKSNVNPSNIIYTDKDGKLRINSLAYSSSETIMEYTFKEGKKIIEKLQQNGEKAHNVVNIFNIVDKEDFEEFLKDVEEYKDTHNLKNLTLAYGYLGNGCRFLGLPECGVDKIPRIKVDQDGRVHLCDLTTKASADLNASLFELSHQCFANREEKLRERGCYTCPTSSWCSKCTELPDFIESHYCELMKKKAYILDYVFLSSIYLKFKITANGLEGIREEEVFVSNEYMFNLISSDIQGEVAPYLPKHTTLLICRDNYFFYSPINNKIFHISKEFAVVIELLLRRVKADKLGTLSSEMLSIDIETANQIVDSVVKTLKNTRVLYRDVE